MKKFFEKVSSCRYTVICDIEILQQLFGVSMYFSKKCNKKPDKNQVYGWDQRWPIAQNVGLGLLEAWDDL